MKTEAILVCPKCRGDGVFFNGDPCVCCDGRKNFTWLSALERLANYFHNPKYASKRTPSIDDQETRLAEFVATRGERSAVERYPALLDSFDACVARFPKERQLINAETDKVRLEKIAAAMIVIEVAARVAKDCTYKIHDQRTLEVSAALITELRSALDQYAKVPT